MEWRARRGPPRTLPEMAAGFRLVARAGNGVWRMAEPAGACRSFFYIAAFGRANGAGAHIGRAGAQPHIMERALHRTAVEIETCGHGIASARCDAARRLSHDRNDSR